MAYESYYEGFEVHDIIMKMTTRCLVEGSVRRKVDVPPSEYVERVTCLHLLAASQSNFDISSLISIVCDLRSDNIENVFFQKIYKRFF